MKPLGFRQWLTLFLMCWVATTLQAESWSTTSMGGRYQLMLEPMVEPIPLARFHRWRLQVNDVTGAPLQHLQVQIAAGMPSHGHGMPSQPVATAQSIAGHYLIEGMKFNMPGDWEVRVALQGVGVADKAIFTFNVSP